MSEVMRRVVLKSHPEGALRSSDFDTVTGEKPVPKDGEMLLRVLIVSVDPMLRIFVDAAPLNGNLPPLPLGSTIPGAAVAEVVESHHSDFAVGDLVEGRFGWQTHAISDGNGISRANPAIGAPENALGIGGLPGFTAYIGLQIAQLRKGQTIVVSGAAGAVGSVVGPLATAAGVRAVGIAGGMNKMLYLTGQASYAATADRHAVDYTEQLKAALPEGADVYFDNVGGSMLLDILPLMKPGGLVLICGLMSQYQGTAPTGRDNLPLLLEAVMAKGIRIQSFSQYGQDALRPAFETAIADLVTNGKLGSSVHVEEGLDRLPDALVGLFENSVAGKVVVRVAHAAVVRTTPLSLSETV